MYLDVADSQALPYGWSRYAQFSLAIVNQIHSKYSIRKGIFLCHTYLILGFKFVLFLSCHLEAFQSEIIVLEMDTLALSFIVLEVILFNLINATVNPSFFSWKLSVSILHS